MKFGKVDQPELVDFTLPSDHPDTQRVLSSNIKETTAWNVGCAKWNKQDLKNFYPRGTKDELEYYATQFNSIELNAFFYRIFPPKTVEGWKAKVGDEFKFCPKVPQVISQFKRLKNVESELEQYIDSISHFGANLGMCFLQMHPTFAPKSFADLEHFVHQWPKDVALSVEVRHPDWYGDPEAFDQLCALLEAHGVTHTLTDTAGRRDLMHMRLTTPKCFVRFTGANHATDYTRLDDWVDRLAQWQASGMEEINFFVHQNMELESPLLTAHLNQKLNERLGVGLTVPKTL